MEKLMKKKIICIFKEIIKIFIVEHTLLQMIHSLEGLIIKVIIILLNQKNKKAIILAHSYLFY